MDLKISCECIPGYQARKGLHTGTVKIDPHKFCHTKSYVVKQQYSEKRYPIKFFTVYTQ